jgi:hypothetical protein
MLNKGTCPKCGTTVSHVTVEYVEVRGGRTNYKGVSYVCDSCNCVLGVEIDPLAVKGDIVKKLRG